MKLILFSIIFLLPALLFAPEKYGSISGNVTDIQTGEPLIGVNVAIAGINQGASTDANGYYIINKVKPGRYNVTASFIGYAKVTVKGVIVKADSNTVINAQLTAESISVSDMCIVACEAPALKASSAPPGFLAIGDFNTEEYSKIDENGFQEAIKKPLSTFAADVDAASYSNARRFIMQNELPYKDAVRTEEFINYFDYDYKLPESNKPLSVNIEYSECPWNKEHKLIHIGLKGKEISKGEQKPSSLVFLIDVSGSMQAPEKLPLLKRSFKLLVEQLKAEDKIAIIVYAGNAGMVLSPTPGNEKEKIIRAIEELEAGGSTAGGEGIRLAYKTAEKNFIKEGNNRVILATDGDFNVGISNTSELVRYVEEKRKENIFLTVLGFGMGNYKDDRLQQLADKGNGNHAYIDNILEAKKVLVNQVSSTLYTIAKDVKIQVEFNPAKISSYRLLGYENRMLDEKDFKDDKKDAGEVGSGHSVTALYEVIPDNDRTTGTYDTKYQQTQIKDGAYKSDEVMTVRIRYKDPDKDESREITEVFKNKPAGLSSTSDNFRFSAAVAEFAMLLRDSEFKGESDFNSVKKLAESSKGIDRYGYRAEFLNLVERSELLMKAEMSKK